KFLSFSFNSATLLAFQFNDGYSENILSFVNNVRTKDGGTHEAGFKTAMTRVFNEYARKVALLKALRSKPVKLITNNPKKLEALQKAGLNVTSREPLWGDVSEFNEKYLQTKIQRSGHFEGGHLHA
ncbi:hypothetical protein ACT4UM_12220, partial [Bacillus sp. SS-TM]